MALGINGAYARVCSPDGIVLSGGFPWLSQSYLGDFDVDAETNRVLDVALEMTRAALGLADDFANGIIASAPAPPFSEQVAGRLVFGTTERRPRAMD